MGLGDRVGVELNTGCWVGCRVSVFAVIVWLDSETVPVLASCELQEATATNVKEIKRRFVYVLIGNGFDLHSTRAG